MKRRSILMRVLSLTVASVVSFQTIATDTGVIFSLAEIRNNKAATMSQNEIPIDMEDEDIDGLGENIEIADEAIYLFPSEATEYKYSFTWNAYDYDDIVKYDIYRDDKKLASIDANEENIYQYSDKKASGGEYTYIVYGLDKNGETVAKSNERKMRYDGLINVSYDAASDFVLEEDMVVSSVALTCSNMGIDLNGHTLTVAGDINLYNTPSIKFNGGTLECVNFNKTMSYNYNSNIYITMNDDKDHFIVNGDFYFPNSNGTDTIQISNGVTEIKGNIYGNDRSISLYDWYTSGTHELILNGNNSQTVDFINDYAKTIFNILKLDNKSKEGVIFYTPLVANEFIPGESNYSFGGYENAKKGWTLTKNETLKEDLVISGGILDLNGNDLHVEGDMILLDGEIDINGGRLIVDGNFTNGYVYPEGYVNPNYSSNNSNYRNLGVIKMINNNDRFIVGGKFTSYSAKSEKGLLTNGQLEVKGDVAVNDYVSNYSYKGHEEVFYTEDNFKVILCGEKAQNLSTPSSSPIANLKVNARNDEKAVSISAYITGVLESEEDNVTGYVYLDDLEDIDNIPEGINIYIKSLAVLNKDITIKNSVTFNAGLDLNGHSLTCEKDLYIYAGLKMTKASDKIKVLGSYRFYSYYEDDANEMTDGTVEVLGDCVVYSAYYSPSGKNKLLISGQGEHTLSISTNNDKAIPLNIIEVSEDVTSINFGGSVYQQGKHYKSLIDPNSLFNTIVLDDVKYTEPNKLEEDDVVWNSNVTLETTTLDLNGKTLTINGNLNIKNASIYFNGGSLIVKGSVNVSDSTNYNTGSYFFINNSNSKFVIEKNLDINSWCDNFSYMNMGELDLYGTVWISGGASYYSYSKSTGNEFIINYCGNGYQSVYINSNIILTVGKLIINNNSGKGVDLADVRVSNLFDDKGNVTKETVYLLKEAKIENNVTNANVYLGNGYTINDETVFNGNLSVGNGLNVNGDVTVKKDLSISSKVNVSGARLTCEGKVSQSGEIKLIKENGNSPELNFKNYDIYSGSSNEWNDGNVYISGDFNIINSSASSTEYAIHASGNNVLYLNGTKKQTISMPYSADYFNKVIINNASADGIDAPYGIRASLIENTNNTPVNGEAQGSMENLTLTGDMEMDALTMTTGKIDLNGHKLTVKGDLIQKGGTIQINNGSLIVNGDYIIEDKAEYSCDAVLLMENKADKVLVNGNFVMGSYRNTKGYFADGVLEVKGDFTQKCYSYNMSATDDFKLLLSGTQKQTVTFMDSQSEKNTYLNLQDVEITNTSKDGVVFVGKVPLAGKFVSHGNKVSGDVLIRNASVFEEDNNSFAGNVYIASSKLTIDKPLNIGGNLTVGLESDKNNYAASLNTDIYVQGNLTVNSGMYINKNQVTVDGDLRLTKGSYTIFTEDESYMLVNGNVLVDNDFNGFDKGTLEIKGDIIFDKPEEDTSSARYWNSIVLSGDGLQKLTLIPSISFGIVELLNPNRAGIEINRTDIPAKEIYYNSVNVKYLSEAKFGYKLEADEVWPDNTVLAGGELDLNGHTLTVDGTLILEAGTVAFNKGKLKVNGNLRLQKVEFDEEGFIEKTSSSTVKFSTKSEEDYLFVGNNIYLDVNSFSWGSGTLELKGGFYSSLYDNYIPSFYDGKLILSGDKKQTFSFATRNSGSISVKDLYIKNTSKEGVSCQRGFYVNNIFSDPDSKLDRFSKVTIHNIQNMLTVPANAQVIFNPNSSDNKLIKDITGINDLVISGDTDLNGHVLHAKTCNIKQDSIYVNNGRLEIEGNLKIDSSDALIMRNDGDYVYVGGNVSLNALTYYYDNSQSYVCLDKGCMEVHGDFSQNGTYDNYFMVSEDFVFIFAGKSGDEIQKIDIKSPKGNLGKIILWRDLDKYSFSFDISGKYEKKDVDETAPNKVTGVKCVPNGPSVTINWNETTDNVGVIGYAIFRDGVRIGSSSETKYVDSHLNPSHEYSYYICAFDLRNNMSTPSDSVKVTTGPDTEAPSVPTGLGLYSGRTGSRLELYWSKSTDNVVVKGYNIYRDGKKIGYTEEIYYEDTTVVAGEAYEYCVSAIDESGNESNKSKILNAAAPKPEIYSVTPTSNSFVGGKNISLNITYIYRNTSSYTGTFYYRKNGEGADAWKKIGSGYSKSNGTNSSYYSCTASWSVADVKSGTYDIKYVLSDPDNNCDERVVTVNIDTEPAMMPDDVSADAGSGVVNIGWSASSSSDVSYYKVYRSKTLKGTKTLLSSPRGTSYQDTDVKNGDVLYYFVSAVDTFGLEGAMTEPVKVTVEADVVNPSVSNISLESDIVGGKYNLEVSVTSSDNRKVAANSLYYRKSGEAKWLVLFENKEADNNVSKFICSVDNIEEGKYELKASAKDTSGNVSTNDDSIIKTFTVDKTGPKQILLGKKTNYSSSTMLSWTASNDDDISYYEIEQKIDGEFKKVADSTACSYMIVGLEANKEYSFRIVGIDVLGNRGTPSDEIIIKTLADSEKPFFNGLSTDITGLDNRKPVSYDFYVKDNVGVNSVKVAYSQDETDDKNWIEYKEIKANGSGKFYNFKFDFEYPELNEGTLYVRMIASDVNGNESEPIVIPYIVDLTAPGKIHNIKAEGYDGHVKISWDKSSEEDVVGYEIYRKLDTAGSTYTKIKDIDLTEGVSFVDSDTEIGSMYYYKVCAIDIGFNEGEFSDEVAAVASQDNTKPEVQGISPKNGAYLTGKAELKTFVSDLGSLKEVEFKYRKASDTDGEWILIDSKEYDEISKVTEDEVSVSFEVSSLENTDYEVRIFAYDISGNLNQDIYAIYTVDTVSPEPTTLTAEQYGYGAVLLNWVAAYGEKPQDDKDALGDDESVAGLGEEDTPEVIMIGDITDRNNPLVDFTRVIDEDYVEVGSGDVIVNENIVNEINANKDIVFENEESVEAYGDTDYPGYYYVYRRRSGEDEFTNLGPVYSLCYVDSGLTIGKKYEYKIGTVDYAGNIAYSNVVSIIPSNVDDEAPVAICSAEYSIREGEEIAFDASNSTDNVGIVSYEWDFGDKEYGKGRKARHSYSEVGTYNGTLKVTDEAGLTGECSFRVNVLKRSAGATHFTVTSTDGNLEGADVCISIPGYGDMNYSTDASGQVTLALDPGTYNVCAYANGYLPVETSFVITRGDNYCPITLEKGNIVTGQLTAKRMTLDDMKREGIDIYDSDNWITYYYVFNGGSVAIKPNKIYVVQFGGGGGCASIYVKTVAPGCSISSMYMMKSYLKKMYQISLQITNQAASGSGFDVRGTNVNFNLPSGLSLVRTSSPQSTSVSVGTLSAGSSRNFEWFIKADKDGTYPLSATVTGILDKTNSNVNCTISSSSPLVVTSEEDNTFADPGFITGKEEKYRITVINKENRAVKGAIITIKDGDKKCNTITNSAGVGTLFINEDETRCFNLTIEHPDYMNFSAASYVIKPEKTDKIKIYRFGEEEDEGEADEWNNNQPVAANYIKYDQKDVINTTINQYIDLHNDFTGTVIASFKERVEEFEIVLVPNDNSGEIVIDSLDGMNNTYFKRTISKSMFTGDDGAIYPNGRLMIRVKKGETVSEYRLSLYTVQTGISSVTFTDSSMIDWSCDLFNHHALMFVPNDRSSDSTYTFKVNRDTASDNSGSYLYYSLLYGTDVIIDKSFASTFTVHGSDLDFDYDKKIYLCIYDEDEKLLEKRELNISVHQMFKFSMNFTSGKLGFTLPSDFPLLGSISFTPEEMEEDNGSGPGNSSSGSSNEDEGNKKGLSATCGCNQNGYYGTIKFNVGDIKNSPLKDKLPPKAKLGYYIEVSFTGNPETMAFQGEVTVGAEISLEKENQVYYTPPVVAGFEINASAEADGTVTLYVDDDSLHFEDFTLDLNLEASLKVFAGLGAADVISAGFFGKATAKFILGIIPQILPKKFEVDGDFGVYAEFLCWEYDLILLNGKVGYNFIDRDFYADGGTIFGDEDSTYDLNNYKLESIDYSNSVWNGNKITNETNLIQLLESGSNKFTKLAMNKAGGDTYLFMIDGRNTNTVMDANVLKYSKYINGKFDNPVTLLSSQRGQYNFDTYEANGNVYIIWQENKEEIANDTAIDTAMNKMELRAAVFNGNNVTDLGFITNNDVYEMAPSIVCDNGTVYAIWYENSANNPFGVSGTNSMKVKKYTGSAWIDVEGISASFEGKIDSYDSGAIDGMLCSVYENNNKIEAVNLKDGSIKEISSCGSNAAVSVFGNENVLTFKENNLIKKYKAAGAETLYEDNNTVLASYQIVNNGTNTTILYAANDEGAGNLYAADYDTEALTFGIPHAITDVSEGKYIDKFTGAYIGSELLTVFESSNVVVEKEKISRTTNLELMKVSKQTDIKVNSVIAEDETSIIPGGKVRLITDIYNNGLKSSKDIVINVKDDEGNVLYNSVIADSIRAGEERCEYIDITLPYTNDLMVLTVTASDAESSSYFDYTVGYTDYSVITDAFETETESDVTATVTNLGCTPSDGTIVFYDGNDESKVYAQYDVQNLYYGEEQEFKYTLTNEQYDGSKTVMVGVKVVPNNEENGKTKNNTSNVYFYGESGVDTYAVIFNYAIDGYDSVTKYVYAGNKVSLPEEPKLDGYKFIGWYNGEEEFTENTVVNKDVTLFAEYEIINQQEKQDKADEDTGNDDKADNKPVKPSPEENNVILVPTEKFVLVKQKVNLNKFLGLEDGKTYEFKLENRADKKKADISKKGILKAKKSGSIEVSVYLVEGKGKSKVSNFVSKNVVQIASLSYTNKKYKSTYENQTVRISSLLLMDYGDRKYKLGDKVSNGVIDDTYFTRCLEENGYTWTIKSSKAKCIKVDSASGEFTSIKNGNTKITFTIKDSEGKNVFKKALSVSNKFIKFSKTTYRVKEGKQVKSKLKNASKMHVEYSSSNESVASVDSKGVIKGVSAGEAEITAKTADGKTYTCKVIVR